MLAMVSVDRSRPCERRPVARGELVRLAAQEQKCERAQRKLAVSRKDG